MVAGQGEMEEKAVVGAVVGIEGAAAMEDGVVREAPLEADHRTQSNGGETQRMTTPLILFVVRVDPQDCQGPHRHLL